MRRTDHVSRGCAPDPRLVRSKLRTTGRCTPWRRAFTLIELMIIMALLGVWIVNIADLVPLAWRAVHRVARDHAAVESQVRLHAYLARDLEAGSLVTGGAHSLTVSLPGGRTVRYVTDEVPERVRREEPGLWAVFPAVRLSVLSPEAPGGACVVRLESLAAARRPPPVLVSAWSKEVPR